MRVCNHPGCPNLIDASRSNRGKCEQHRLRSQRAYDATRPKYLVEFYHSQAWRELRALVLQEEPNCRLCGSPTEQADHIKSVREFPQLALERSNCRGLCLPCHRSVTRKAEGQRGK